MVVKPESYPAHADETVAEAQRWAEKNWPWPVSGDSTLRRTLGQRLSTSLPEGWLIEWYDDGEQDRRWYVSCSECTAHVRLLDRDGAIYCYCRAFDDVHRAFEYVWTTTDHLRPGVFREDGEAHACRPLPLRAWTRDDDQNETEETDR